MELRGGNMGFSQDEANAKTGQAVRVIRRLPDRRDIKIGALGTVVAAWSIPTVEIGVGTLGTTGGKKTDGWVVEVEFDLPGGDFALVPVEKDDYHRCLQEC